MKKSERLFKPKQKKEAMGKNDLLIKYSVSFLVLLIVPMLLLGFIWYNNLRRNSIEQESELGKKGVEAAIEQIELTRLSISHDLLNILYGSRLRLYKTYQKREDMLNLVEDFQGLKVKHPTVYSIYLYDENIDRIYDSNRGWYDKDEFYDTEWLDCLDSIFGEQILGSRINLNSELMNSEKNFNGKLYKEKWVITVVTPKLEGIRLAVNIDIQELEKKMQEHYGTTERMIRIASGETVLELFSDAFDSKDKYFESWYNDKVYFAMQIDKTDLYYIEGHSLNVIEEMLEGYGRYIMTVILVLTIVLAGTAVFVTNKIYRPYDELFSRIKAIKMESFYDEKIPKEWKGIQKVFKDVRIQEDEREHDRKIAVENSSMFRMLINGIISQEYFMEHMRVKCLWDKTKLKSKIIICELSSDYLSTDKIEYSKQRLNDVINIQLLEQKEGISIETVHGILTIYIVNTEIESLEKTEVFLQKLINELTDYVNCFYVSDVFECTESIRHHYIECLQKVENVVFFRDCSCCKDQVFQETADDLRSVDTGTYTMEIIRSIVSGDEKALQENMELLAKNLFLIQKKERVQNLCTKIMVGVDREIGIDGLLFAGKSSIKKVYDIKSFQNLLEHMTSVFVAKMEILQNIDKKQEEIYFEKAITYIQDNYMKNINVTEVADQIGISYVYLSKIFKIYQKDNMRIVDYLNIFRIEKATELLIETNDTLSEIAEKVGYNNVQSLSRFFKKYKGTTPGEYRKKQLV